MASLSLVLHSKTYSDGTRPVMLQCIVGESSGNTWKRRTICRVKPEQWDADRRRVRKHPNQVLLNSQLHDAYTQAESRLLESQRRGGAIDPQYILYGGEAPKVVEVGLLAHGRGYVERLALQRQTRTAEKYTGHLNRLADYLGQTPKGEQIDLPLANVSEKWLLDYSVWLQANGAKSPNTLHRRMAFMTTILNDARKRGLMHHEPMAFLAFKEQKAQKLKLTPAQIGAIEGAEVTGRLRDARNIFLMQLYAYGARIGDAIAWLKTDVQRRPTGTYLSYRSQKTNDLLEVRLNKSALVILDEYKDVPGPYLLPWLQKYTPTPGLSDADKLAELYGKIESATTSINLQLKALAKQLGIEGKLTSHVARHSFATLADSRITDKRQISAALGHKRFSTTEIYLADLRSEQINDTMGELWE